MKLINEDFYEIDGKQFFDYQTEDIKKWIIPDKLPYSSELFDITTLGGYSNYTEYLHDKKNIVMMTPKEYFERTAEGFGITPNQNIDEIGKHKDILNHLHDVIFIAKKKLPLCYVSASNGSKQEGRHRMYFAASLFGWNKSFPVLLVP